MMRKLLALAACLCALGLPAAAQNSKAQEIDNYIKPFADANQFSRVAPAASDFPGRDWCRATRARSL